MWALYQAQRVQAYTTADVQFSWNAMRSLSLSVVGQNCFNHIMPSLAEILGVLSKLRRSALRKANVANRAKVMRAHTRDTGFFTPHNFMLDNRQPPMPRLRIVAVIVAFGWALSAVPILYAQHSTPTEYEVKAAYLYKLGKFVEWPDNVTSSGDDSFPHLRARARSVRRNV